jgi:hypothetical protein
VSKPPERSLILHAEEVRRVLADGTVTVCRPVRPQPNLSHGLPVWRFTDRKTGEVTKCPFGAPGSKRWVKEAFWQSGCMNCGRIHYVADEPKMPGMMYEKRSSVHMPRWASRIDLDLTGVEVKQVQGISGADVEAMGCPEILGGDFCVDGMDSRCVWFMDRWDSRHAKRGLGWDGNPWIWVGAFRRVAP